GGPTDGQLGPPAGCRAAWPQLPPPALQNARRRSFFGSVGAGASRSGALRILRKRLTGRTSRDGPLAAPLTGHKARMNDSGRDQTWAMKKRSLRALFHLVRDFTTEAQRSGRIDRRACAALDCAPPK